MIQQVLYELAAPYYGHAYYVTGNAVFNALARRVDAETRQRLHVSHGVFLPGEYGRFPEAHSQSGGVPYLGTELRPIEGYEDLFLFRDPAQRWLLASRPRDAHNTHDVQCHGGRRVVAPQKRFGRPSGARNTKRTMTLYLHCYLHAGRGDDGIIPLGEDVLDGVRVGGGRNYGFGELTLTETQTIDLDALDYSGLTEDGTAREYRLELLSPYVLRSEYPGSDEQSPPWWWEAERGSVAAAESLEELRARREELVIGGETHAVETIDHGQVVRYAGDTPIETAKNGVLRVGTHKKLGYGEFRVRPVGVDRVPERRGAVQIQGGD